MKPKLPLVGIPCREDVSSADPDVPSNAQSATFVSALNTVGAVTFFIPLKLETAALRKLFDIADGILLAGGGDIDPAFYDQEPHPTLARVQRERDLTEITLSHWAAAENKPLLGVCRGIQVMAVALGGALYQDLPSLLPAAVLHNYSHQTEGSEAHRYLVHEVTLNPESYLAEKLGSQAFKVNSLHHQAMQTAPRPMRPVGYSSDGVIEAIELPDHPFFCGVQWHPELIMAQPESRRIFEIFVEACARG